MPGTNGLVNITTGDLAALYRSIFRHFIYELLPAFTANACSLHDPWLDANGNPILGPDGQPLLQHDALFEAVGQCFQQMADIGLMSPLASTIAQSVVPALAGLFNALY